MVQENEFSKSELVEMLELIETAQRCRLVSDFKPLILKTKDLVGADYAICGICRASGQRVEDLKCVINGNYPEKWLLHYLFEEFYKADPVVKYHSTFSFAQFWSEAFKLFDDIEAKRVINHAGEFGLKYGISNGIYVPEMGDVIVFSFSSSNDVFDNHHKKILELLSLHFNRALKDAYYRAGASPLQPSGGQA